MEWASLLHWLAVSSFVPMREVRVMEWAFAAALAGSLIFFAYA